MGIDDYYILLYKINYCFNFMTLQGEIHDMFPQKEGKVLIEECKKLIKIYLNFEQYTGENNCEYFKRAKIACRRYINCDDLVDSMSTLCV
jgi:hypothetical protein